VYVGERRCFESSKLNNTHRPLKREKEKGLFGRKEKKRKKTEILLRLEAIKKWRARPGRC
jgi:hypothetical protein